MVSHARNRWFVLGTLFLIVNAVAVLPTVRQWISPRFVRAVLIAPESSELCESDHLVWKFSSAMVSPAETGRWERSGPVTITPLVPGLFKWATPDELRFKPDSDWPKCTIIDASFTRGLHSVDLRPLRGQDKFEIRTKSLDLLTAQQVSFEPGKSAVLMLGFNVPVTQGDLQEHLAIVNHSTTTNLPVEISAYNAGSREVLVSVPADLLIAETNELEISLSAGLQSTAGPVGLEYDIKRPVRIYKSEMQVINVTPEMHGPFGPQAVIASFSTVVDPQSLVASVVIEPEVAFKVEPVGDYYGHLDSAFRLSGNFRPGRRYTVTFRAGLVGKSGSVLKSNVTRNVYFEDSEPGIRITTEGKYLSPYGKMSLPFETMNLGKCKVRARRVYSNNIVYLAMMRWSSGRYYWSDRSDDLGSQVFEKEISFNPTPGEIARHQLDLRELTGGKSGVYFLEISGIAGDRSPIDRQHLILSDIGITAKHGLGELIVWANSINTLSAVQNVDVRLYSLKNQELATGVTDTNGLTRLTFSTNTTLGAPLVVTATKGDDMTYIVLNDCQVTGSTRDGERSYLTTGYEAFLFTDRGVYRPGEAARLKVIVRGRNAECPPSFPVTLTVSRPDGKHLGKYPGMLNDFGTTEFAVHLPDYVPTGDYSFSVQLADSTVLGSTHASVEEFAPPTIRVDVNTDTTRCRPGEEIKFVVSAQHLFGGPAAGLPVEGLVEFRPQPFAHARWVGFHFGDEQKKFGTIRKPLTGSRLDADGGATFRIDADAAWRPASSLRAVLIGTVLDTSGRAITAVGNRAVDIYPFYIGISNRQSLATIGKESSFEIAVVLPDGSVGTGKPSLKAVMEKTVWSSFMKRQDNGTWSWCSEQQTSEIRSDAVTLDSGRGTIAFTPSDWGQYRLTVKDLASGTSTSIEFNACEAGQEWSDRSMESQGNVELKMDKDRYLAGETARLLVRAPFTGKAIVAIESTTVLRHLVIDMTNNSTEIEIPVEASFAPNVHCSVSVMRPVKPEKLWGPHRAFGRCMLRVDSPERRLTVKLTAPEVMRPRQKLEIEVETLDSAGHGAEAEVVVAAVDEGICMLTAFQVPDPYSFFFAPRWSGVSQHDLYQLLMPELEEHLAGDTSLPGGGELASLGRRLNPVRARRFKPVSLWSSSFRTDSAGKAKISMDVPEFTGQLRLMAVAVDKQRFGNVSAAVKVKRPLIVQAGLPRFLAPGDKCDMPVHVFNETGEDGEAVVTVSCRGPLECDGSTTTVRRVHVPKASSTRIEIPVMARGLPGAGVCRIEVTMGQERFDEEIELPIRPPVSRVTLRGSGRVEPGTSAQIEMSTAWVDGTATNDVWISNLPAIELGSGLSYLLQYPYGCLEQTTSKSFPLLYLHDLAGQIRPGWLEQGQVARFVDDGIARILSMQRRNGSFGAWAGSEAYMWGSVYATHFLIEASNAGYNVPVDRLRSALAYLVATAAGRSHGDDEESTDIYTRSYAVYVLALAGKPQHGIIGRLRQLPDFERDRMCRVNVAAALMAGGLRKDAHELLTGLNIAESPTQLRETGGSLRSSVRDDAILLATLVDADPAGILLPAMVQRINKARISGRWYTTQENALALMAIGKYCRYLAKDRAPLEGSVSWNNGTKSTMFSNREEFHAIIPELATGFITVTNAGKGPLYYAWEVSGIPTNTRMKEQCSGIAVTREILEANGDAVKSAELVQGRLYVVRLAFKDLTGGLENIVIEDLLPAGLEIENPNLKTSQSVSWLKDVQTLPVLHADIRDDRLILFPAPFSGSTKYYYTVRAVSSGTFAMPPVTAECMYNPEIRSIQGAGVVSVKK